MNDTPLIWLIYLLTYSNTRCVLANDGLMSMVWGKMGFSDKNRSLVENLCVFSERELKFTFAICHRRSVCRLSVVCLSSVVCRLSSVTFVRPTQTIEIFRNVSTP